MRDSPRDNVKEEYLGEAKKKCKDGYKYDSDKKKCVKKKKKSSSSKTTIIVGRGFGRPIYGGGMVHHHHHHDNDHGDKPNGGGNGGGNGGNGNGGGGDAGVSEMFDLLGDMLFQEMTGAEMNAMKGMTDEKSTKEKTQGKSENLKRMERMRREYEKAAKQPSPIFDNMNKEKEQMMKATKPRQGSSD